MKLLRKQLETVVSIYNRQRISEGKAPFIVIFDVIDLNMTVGEVLAKKSPITTDEVIEFSEGLRKMRGLEI